MFYFQSSLAACVDDDFHIFSLRSHFKEQGINSIIPFQPERRLYFSLCLKVSFPWYWMSSDIQQREQQERMKWQYVMRKRKIGRGFLLSTYQKTTRAGSEEFEKLQPQTVKMGTSEGRDNNNILEKVAIPKGSLLHQWSPLFSQHKKTVESSI